MSTTVQDGLDLGQRWRKAIRQMHGRARAELGIELPLPAFESRVRATLDDALPRGSRSERRDLASLACLHGTDLYLATAAAHGDPRAQESLLRWYGGLIESLSRASGQTDLVEQLIGHRESSAIRLYTGLSSLRRWLQACAARAMPPPMPRETPYGETPLAPEARRSFDIGSRHAFDSLPAAARLGAVLVVVAGVPVETAARLAGLTARQLRDAIAQTARRAEENVERALRACGLDRAERERAWRDFGALVGVRTQELPAISLTLLREAAIRSLAMARAEGCPDANLLLAAIAFFPGVARQPIDKHLSRCWPCLQAALAVGPAPGTAPRRGRRVLALGIGVFLAGTLLATLRLPHTSAPPPGPSHALARATGAPGHPAPGPAAAGPGELDAVLLARTPPPRVRSAMERTPPPVGPGPERNQSGAGRSGRLEPVARPEASNPAAPSPSGHAVPVASTPASTPPPRPSPSPTPGVPARTPPGPEPARAPTPAVVAALSEAPPKAAAPATEPDRPRMPPASLPLRAARGSSRAAQLVNLAVRRYREGEEENAVRLLVRAVGLEPDLQEAHFDLAILYQRLGEPESAARHWARTTSLAPR